MVTYSSLPGKSTDASPSFFYSESSGGAVVKTATTPYVTLTDTQTLTNKTLTDSTTLFQDNADNTKKLAFNLDGIQTATTRTLSTQDLSGFIAITANIPNYLSGCTLSNNGTDAVNDIDVAAGVCMDSTNTYAIPVSAITKRLDALWTVGTNNGGLDTGAIANTTYHVYAIRRLDTGVTDVIFSTSASAPTLPTNYTIYRRIGSIVRSGATILQFRQDGDLFLYDTPINEVAATNPGTAAVNRNMTVPQGIVTYPLMAWSIKNDTTATVIVYISPLTVTDNAPSAAFSTFRSDSVGAGGGCIVEHVATNTTGQVRSRLSASGASDILRCALLGWRDTRGR